MKKLLLSTIATAALAAAGPAGAADLPAQVYKAAPVVAAAGCGQFGGFYAGAHGAWAYYDHTYNGRDGLGPFIDTGLPSTVNISKDGPGGGVQAGYNWQTRCTVFGVEADWTFARVNASTLVQDGDQSALVPTTDTINISSQIRSFGTLRGRSGVVVDNMLLYVTGGLAAARFKRDWTYFEDGPATTGFFSDSKTRYGWAAGFGTEWCLFDNWSLKSEVLYMRFSQDRTTVTGNGIIGSAGVPYRIDSNNSIWTTKIGLNYRFNGGPVTSRY